MKPDGDWLNPQDRWSFAGPKSSHGVSHHWHHYRGKPHRFLLPLVNDNSAKSLVLLHPRRDFLYEIHRLADGRMPTCRLLIEPVRSHQIDSGRFPRLRSARYTEAQAWRARIPVRPDVWR